MIYPLLVSEIAGWLAGYDSLESVRVADGVRCEREASMVHGRHTHASLPGLPTRQHRAAAPTAWEAGAAGAAPGPACLRDEPRCACSQPGDTCGCPEACEREGCQSCEDARLEARDGPGLAAASTQRMEARLAALEAKCAGVQGLGQGLAQLQEQVSVLRQAQLDTQVKEAPTSFQK